MSVPQLQPARWPGVRLRHLCRINPPLPDKSIAPEQEVSHLPMERIGADGRLDLSLTVTSVAARSGLTIFQDGDVIVAKITPCFENGKGALCAGLVNGVGIGTTELHVLRPTVALLPGFLFYRTQATDFRRLGEASMSGAAGQKRVADDFIRDFRVVLPPPAQQAAIVAFLDRETGRIDCLIEKKQRLIALLEEKRAALIHRAVTQGLDPSVPMKPSGVDWIGEIPSHWSVWKLSHAFRRIGSGTTPPTDRTEYYDGDVPWVTTTELRENLITETTVTLTSRALQEFPTLQLYPPGTLLIAMYGATIGRLALLCISATTNQACCALAQSDVFDTRFSYYWLHAFRDPLVAAAAGGGQPNINQQKIAALRIPAPPLAEQREIVQYLDSETTRVEPVIRKNQRLIALLHEYRLGIISSAVTGRIDVGAAGAGGGMNSVNVSR